MFTTTDPQEHKALKRPVAQKFSMSSLRTLEYLVDPCSEIFTKAMLDLQGQVVDLGEWAQWYAFDVIGAITFSRRFGFMENRKDVKNIISGIELGLAYAGIIGQVPSLHRYLLGNLTLRRILGRLGVPDPIAITTEASTEIVTMRNGSAADRQDVVDGFRLHQRVRLAAIFERTSRLPGLLSAGTKVDGPANEPTRLDEPFDEQSVCLEPRLSETF
jgi:hypothetical protein